MMDKYYIYFLIFVLICAIISNIFLQNEAKEFNENIINSMIASSTADDNLWFCHKINNTMSRFHANSKENDITLKLLGGSLKDDCS